MTSAEVLADFFGRVKEIVEGVLDGSSPEHLTARLDSEANSIAWLVWHLTRVQDDHVAHVAGTEQAWTSGGWTERFDLPLEVADIGYGHDSDKVAIVTAGADELRGYHEAVYENTSGFLGELSDADMDRVVDDRWDPPVTLGVRLVSVVADDLQHAGQAAFIRGILDRG
jgi:hypothetical protein